MHGGEFGRRIGGHVEEAGVEDVLDAGRARRADRVAMLRDALFAGDTGETTQ